MTCLQSQGYGKVVWRRLFRSLGESIRRENSGSAELQLGRGAWARPSWSSALPGIPSVGDVAVALPPELSVLDAAGELIHNLRFMDADFPAPTVPLLQKFLPALRLDRDLYDDLASNPLTRGQAFLVVLTAGALNGIGLRASLGPMGIWAGVFAALGGWVLWTFVIRAIARLFGNRRNGRSLARPLAFANIPSFFLILGGIPELQSTVRLIVPFWLVVTSAAAVQSTYLTSRWRAAAITGVAFVAYMFLGFVISVALE